MRTPWPANGRDSEQQLPPPVPGHYFPGEDLTAIPLNCCHGHGNLLYANGSITASTSRHRLIQMRRKRQLVPVNTTVESTRCSETGVLMETAVPRHGVALCVRIGRGTAIDVPWLTSERVSMRSTISAVARVTTVVVSGLAFATIVGSGIAQAAPRDCTIQRDAFAASGTCHDNDAPPGREYFLSIDCWGLHGIPNAFPFYAVGPYTASTRSFLPTDRASANCSTSWGAPALNVGVVTNAHVEIYRQ